MGVQIIYRFLFRATVFHLWSCITGSREIDRVRKKMEIKKYKKMEFQSSFGLFWRRFLNVTGASLALPVPQILLKQFYIDGIESYSRNRFADTPHFAGKTKEFPTCQIYYIFSLE